METLKSLSNRHKFSFSFYYGLTSFSSALLHNIFLVHYFDVFFTILKLNRFYFLWGQLLFMIWNSLNDPIFGYLIEKQIYTENLNHLQAAKFKTQIIKYGGLLWSISFLTIFISLYLFNENSSQFLLFFYFVFSLYFYDGCLSLTLLAHGSLLADISIKSEDRSKSNMYSSIGGSIGSNSIFFAYFFWEKEKSNSLFLNYCFLIFLISLFGFVYSTLNILHFIEKSEKKLKSNNQDLMITEKDKNFLFSEIEKKAKPSISFQSFLLQFKNHHNFWIFTTFNLIQVFNCHFNNNFLLFFLTFLQKSSLHSVALSLSAIFPHLFVIILHPMIKRFGVYKIIFYLTLMKFFWSILGILGTENNFIILIFILIIGNKVINETVCRHGNLILSDLVDEDFILNRRILSHSSIIWGANALFTKPGVSLAPILESFLFEKNEEGIIFENPYNFKILLIVPLFCSILQIGFWKKFDLFGDKLKKIKSQRTTREKFNNSEV